VSVIEAIMPPPLRVNPANLPAELWAMNTVRVRAGKGPVRVVPTAESTGHETLIYAKPNGRGAQRLYSKSDLFDTIEQACAHGMLLAEREHDWEVKKHNDICRRLADSHSTCKAGLRPSGKA
jgi:hypothetical protein